MKIKLVQFICGILAGVLVPALAIAQADCNTPVEKIIGAKGSTYTIPCKDMVILDIATYSRYRYVERQFHLMDSAISGYTVRIDSLDKANSKNKALLEEKLKNKDEVIDRYKNHASDITAVLEKCKADSEGFVKAYQEKLEENRKLEAKVKKLKRERNTVLGVSGGLAAVLLLVLL